MQEEEKGGIALGVGAIFCIGVVCIALLIAAFFGLKAIGRYQARADRSQDRSQALLDAKNKVKVSSIEIKNQAQRIQVAKQQAEIRLQKAIGVREAQDEIAKTLTPLYVQFEMTDALKQIAKSGKNNSVVYLPSGANGIPLVATVNPNQVTEPTP
jgi:predicted membrane metal-binding protein